MTHYQRQRRAGGILLGTETGEDVPIVHTRSGAAAKYSQTEVESALLAVVMEGGVVRRAAELVGVPAATLSRWVNQEHYQRYSELRVKHGPELEKRAVEGLLNFVRRAEDAKYLALEKTIDELESGDTKDPGATLRNIATAQGISVTKILELSGRPTSTVMHKSPAELMARLQALGAVDSSADEIPVATLVETNPVAPLGDSNEAAGD